LAVAKGAPARGALLAFPIPRSRGMGLALFILRRLLWLIPVLFFVILITFTLAHLTPGSPWDREGRQLPENVIRNLNEKYGLDLPIWQQFALYVWRVVHFDFGESLQHSGQDVGTLLAQSWPYTFALGSASFLFIVPVSIGLGVIAALRQNTWLDYLTVGLGTLGASVPNFVFGLALIIGLSVEMNRLTEGTFFLPTGGLSFDETLPQHLVMPVLAISLLPIAFLARLTRSSTLEALRQDFVRTAWAKGLRERLVVVKHVLKNSLIPVVTALGPLFAFLVTGSFVIESVFSIPGIGRSFVQAVSSRDYPMILGTTILYALLVAIANLIVDVTYTFIDPRVRIS